MKSSSVRRPAGRAGTAFFIFFFVFFGVQGLCAAEPVEVHDPLSSPAWQYFYNNEYDSALSCFIEETRSRPNGPGAYNHIAQTILYRELFRNGALESELVTGNNPFLRRAKVNISAENRKAFEDAMGRATSLGEARLEKNEDDAEALYDLSVTYGLRANFEFLVDKAWTDALRNATESRKYSNRVLALEPGLSDAYLIQGLHNYVVGSLPFYLRMVGFLAGFHGDRDKGMQELESVAAHGVLNKYDARILLAVIYRREQRPGEAIPLLKELSHTFPHNYLLQLEQVQMYSDAGNKGAALSILADVERLRNAQTEGYRDLPLEKIRYLRGNLLFWYGDLGPALTEIRAVTAKADELDLNTAVLAWLRLGQLYDLQGQHGNAVFAYKKTMKAAPDSAAANEAKGYILSPYKRKMANS
jgi:tetratricopeptide (TPR) repeat protein